MELVEFIVFLITLTLMVFLAIRRAREARKAQYGEEPEPEQQEEALREFLQSMNIEMVEEPLPPARKSTPPVTPPVAHSAEEFPSLPKERKRLVGSSKDWHLTVHEEPSRVRNLLHRLQSPKEMVMLSVVLEKPKSLREP